MQPPQKAANNTLQHTYIYIYTYACKCVYTRSTDQKWHGMQLYMCERDKQLYQPGERIGVGNCWLDGLDNAAYLYVRMCVCIKRAVCMYGLLHVHANKC